MTNTTTTTKKPKLSATAKMIADQYQKDIKGHESFLTREMKFAMLTQAMYGLMVNRYNPGLNRNEETSVYVEAMGELIDHLEM
jgi:hypothetical protein